MKNSIKKINSEFEVVEFDNKKTFTLKKEESTITFYDERLIEDVIDKKFNKKYKNLLYIIMDINNSDDATESDCDLVRSQIDELRNLLINKYGKYINKELLNKYMKMLLILENKISVPERFIGKSR